MATKNLNPILQPSDTAGYEGGQKVPITWPKGGEVPDAGAVDLGEGVRAAVWLANVAQYNSDLLLADRPALDLAGRRAYLVEFLLRRSPFISQARLAKYLGLSPGRV